MDDRLIIKYNEIEEISIEVLSSGHYFGVFKDQWSDGDQKHRPAQPIRRVSIHPFTILEPMSMNWSKKSSKKNPLSTILRKTS